MTTRPRVTIVSPHFDDAPLSLGQSLLDGPLSRCRVNVRVIFGRTNWTRWMHPTPGRARAVGAWRRTEEAAAAARFGYRFGVDSWSEAILRTGDLDPEVLRDADTDVSDDPLVGPIAHRLRTLRWSTDLLLLPAGLGDHVDHRIVSTAGSRLAAEDPSGIAFYEDRPYAAFMAADERRADLDRLGVPLEPVDVSGPISESVHRWVRRCYPSQIEEYFVTAMARDRRSEAVERVWFPVGHGAPWS